ncbi:MAG: saccharopine dehydrogenase C-terminal domain-containing protein [Nitrososphaerota archaeon]
MQGKKGGKPTKRVYDIVFPPKPEWRMSCVQFGVGVLSSIAAMMIARGEIINRGVVPPGRCVEPELFISEIPKHGIRITITQTEDFS